MQTLLEEALLIAVVAHKGQKDKAGEPYIFHPLRLMFRVNSPEEKIVALLHDVVEDSNVTLTDLKRKGFGGEVIKAVSLLTHDKAVSYQDYVKKIKPNPLAKSIKVADLEDNMNITRLKIKTPDDEERLKKYQWAHQFLNTQT